MNQKEKVRLEELRWKVQRTPKEEEEFQKLNTEFQSEGTE